MSREVPGTGLAQPLKPMPRAGSATRMKTTVARLRATLPSGVFRSCQPLPTSTDLRRAGELLVGELHGQDLPDPESDLDLRFFCHGFQCPFAGWTISVRTPPVERG